MAIGLIAAICMLRYGQAQQLQRLLVETNESSQFVQGDCMQKPVRH